jgi:hypothetical protein
VIFTLILSRSVVFKRAKRSSVTFFSCSGEPRKKVNESDSHTEGRVTVELGIQLRSLISKPAEAARDADETHRLRGAGAKHKAPPCCPSH